MDSESGVAYTGHENLLAMKHAHNYHIFLGELIRRFGERAQTVVDFGAGMGAIAECVKPWANELICVEPDKTQLDFLKSAGYKTEKDISHLPSESVDYVYTINVLEHINNDREAIQNIFNILKSGGRLFIYVPALQWLYSSMDAAVGHVRRYHMVDLIAKISDAGFIIKRREYVDSLGVPTTLIYKLVGPSCGSINVRALMIYDRFIFPVSRVLDRIFFKIGGKNLLVVCEKP